MDQESQQRVQRETDDEKQRDEFEKLQKDAEQRCKTLEENLDRREQDAQRAEKRRGVLEGLNKDAEQLCKSLWEGLQQNREGNERLHKEPGCMLMLRTMDRVRDLAYCETETSKTRSKLQKLQNDLKKLKPTKKCSRLLTQLRLETEEHVRVIAEYEKTARTGKMDLYAMLDKDLINCDDEESLAMGLAIKQDKSRFFVLTREEDRDCIPCVQWKEAGLVSKGVKRALDNVELAAKKKSTNAINSQPTGQT